MSGWIKVEKDLLTDPRFMRMAKAVCNACVTQQRCDHHDAVTQVLGALVRLWIYADSHIREDDTLDLGPDEINEVVGFKGFAQLMPADWLQVIHTHCVELLGFQEHNGAVAKKKAQTAKRVAKHRIRTVTQDSNADAPGSNAPVTLLGYQTRPDQTRPDVQSAHAQTAKLTGTGKMPVTNDEALRARYPKFGGRQDWLTPLHLISGIIERGWATWDQLLDAVARYAAFVAAGGVSGPQYVLTPAKFFGAADKPWAQAWDPPAKPETETEKRHRLERVELQKLMDGRGPRGLADFRDPLDGEPAGVYATKLRQAEIDLREHRPAGQLGTVIAGLRNTTALPK